MINEHVHLVIPEDVQVTILGREQEALHLKFHPSNEHEKRTLHAPYLAQKAHTNFFCFHYLGQDSYKADMLQPYNSYLPDPSQHSAIILDISKKGSVTNFSGYKPTNSVFGGQSMEIGPNNFITGSGSVSCKDPGFYMFNRADFARSSRSGSQDFVADNIMHGSAEGLFKAEESRVLNKRVSWDQGQYRAFTNAGSNDNRPISAQKDKISYRIVNETDERGLRGERLDFQVDPLFMSKTEDNVAAQLARDERPDFNRGSQRANEDSNQFHDELFDRVIKHSEQIPYFGSENASVDETKQIGAKKKKGGKVSKKKRTEAEKGKASGKETLRAKLIKKDEKNNEMVYQIGHDEVLDDDYNNEKVIKKISLNEKAKGLPKSNFTQQKNRVEVKKNETNSFSTNDKKDQFSEQQFFKRKQEPQESGNEEDPFFSDNNRDQLISVRDLSRTGAVKQNLSQKALPRKSNQSTGKALKTGAPVKDPKALIKKNMKIIEKEINKLKQKGVLDTQEKLFIENAKTEMVSLRNKLSLLEPHQEIHRNGSLNQSLDSNENPCLGQAEAMTPYSEKMKSRLNSVAYVRNSVEEHPRSQHAGNDTKTEVSQSVQSKNPVVPEEDLYYELLELNKSAKEQFRREQEERKKTKFQLGEERDNTIAQQEYGQAVLLNPAREPKRNQGKQLQAMGTSQSKSRLYEKQMMEKRRTERELELMREKMASEETKGCTFQPKLIANNTVGEK
jgi:hypothetical protein